jgi:hypothetical protein
MRSQYARVRRYRTAVHRADAITLENFPAALFLPAWIPRRSHFDDIQICLFRSRSGSLGFDDESSELSYANLGLRSFTDMGWNGCEKRRGAKTKGQVKNGLSKTGTSGDAGSEMKIEIKKEARHARQKTSARCY